MLGFCINNLNAKLQNDTKPEQHIGMKTGPRVTKQILGMSQ